MTQLLVRFVAWNTRGTIKPCQLDFAAVAAENLAAAVAVCQISESSAFMQA